MAPSSAKRRSVRKRESTTRQTAANSSATNSPSRPAKRRKTAPRKSTARPVEADAETKNERSDDETSEDEAVNAAAEVADRVVEILDEAKDASNVVKEHSNELKGDADHSISAYAKIAGRNWTYFVKDPSINIGRFPDVKAGSEHITITPGQESHPHIDLGPSKHVSRLHAKLFFNSEDENWHLEINGRNGVKVNDVMTLKGHDTVLRSGDVLKIDQTEMIFVLPGVPSVVHPRYLERLDRPPQAADQASSGPLPHAHPLAQTFRQPATYVSPYAAPTANGYHEPSEAGSMVAQGQVTPARTNHGAEYAQHAASSAQKGTPQRYQSGAAESTEAHVNYADDSMKDRKPPMSYATLIAQAILAGPNEKSSLNGIYEWIKTNFAYYRYLEAGWQNSIRHNLSLNQSFQRVGRDTHEPGKGGLWYIAEDKIDEFRKQGLKMTSRGGARQASNPASPAPKRSPKKKTPPRKSTQGAASQSGQAGDPSASLAESSASVPLDNGAEEESHTPSRRGKASAPVGLGVHSLPQLSSDASPLPSRPPYLNRSAASGASPPTLTSSNFFAADADGFGSSIFTPAPQRHEPRMTAPSTAKLPSKYLPQSSPAPFWKNVDSGAMHLGSEISPVKQDPDQTLMGGLQSSSPPPPSANGSPTRLRGKMDAGLTVGGGGSASGAAAAVSVEQMDEVKFERPAVPAVEQENTEEDDDDEDDDEQLDLMGSFPKIGQASRSAA